MKSLIAQKISKIPKIILLVALVACMIYVIPCNDPVKENKVLESLKVEFSRIKIMPYVSIVYEGSVSYVGKTSISATYFTSATDSEIQIFYHEELVKNGWLLINQKKIYDWGRDLGGATFTYEKQNLEFIIQYAGDRMGYGWAYSIALHPKRPH